MNLNRAFKIKILTLSAANSSSAPPLGDLPQYSRNHRRREISSNVETRLNGYILQHVEGDSLVDECCRGALEYRNYQFLVFSLPRGLTSVINWFFGLHIHSVDIRSEYIH